MDDGRLVKIAKWIECNNLIIAQKFGSITLTLVVLWIGLWAPGEWVAYQAQNHTVNFELWDAILYWVAKWTPWLFISAVIMAIYGGIGGAIDAKAKTQKIESLTEELSAKANISNELEEAQLSIDYHRGIHADTVYSVTSDYLGHLSTDHLNYNDTERASLYLHNEGRFILAGRFSKNGELTKGNRSAFPDDEGCIGQTWNHGGQSFIELPDDETEYLEHLKNELGIDKGLAKDLRMKSIVYCSYALEDGFRRIGIVMFESTAKGVLNSVQLEELVEKHKSYLIEMLKRTRSVNALIAYQNGEE